MSGERNGNELLWLLKGLTEGNADAWTEFIKTHLPELRRGARKELNRQNLRHEDSRAICQSVFRRVLEKMKAGSVVLEDPTSLLRLLMAMIGNRVADQVAYEQAAKRDIRRRFGAPVEELELASSSRDPANQVADDDFFEALLNTLDPWDAQAIRDRRSGADWGTIAAATGSNADTVRVRVMRQIARFRQALHDE